MGKVAEDVITEAFPYRVSLPATFWEITTRQKEIMMYLENPTASVTNKTVQKLFNISQITASRDLARLANLGLLLAHGKGRSVYYTKV